MGYVLVSGISPISFNHAIGEVPVKKPKYIRTKSNDS